MYYAYPTPERLALATAEELRGCGLSTRKAEYVQNISALEKFKAYDDIQEIISELCEIRGIGVWTAELAIPRSMHRSDAMPADDLGLRRCIARYYCQGKMVTGNECRRISETWGGWKGLAGFYLLTAERMVLGISLHPANAHPERSISQRSSKPAISLAVALSTSGVVASMTFAVS